MIEKNRGNREESICSNSGLVLYTFVVRFVIMCEKVTDVMVEVEK